jgi:hypothetical protein
VAQVEEEAGRIRNEAAMATVSATEAQAETIRRAAAAEAEVRRIAQLCVYLLTHLLRMDLFVRIFVRLFVHRS